jgi:hypothetical protein
MALGGAVGESWDSSFVRHSYGPTRESFYGFQSALGHVAIGFFGKLKSQPRSMDTSA